MNLSAKINNTIRLNRMGQSTKSLRKLKNKSVLLALALSSAVISMTFLSCSNLAGGASSDNACGGTPADSQIILCTGNISTSGAVSENVAGILSSALAPTSAISSAGVAGNESQPALVFRVCFATSRFVIQQSSPIPLFCFREINLKETIVYNYNLQ